MVFVVIYQVFMVGVDVCGFVGLIMEEFCVCWVIFGVFVLFYCNYNEYFFVILQEFYCWESVIKVVCKVIDICYCFFDYIYIVMYKQIVDGIFFINFVFYLYFNDVNMFGFENQYFYGFGFFVVFVIQEGFISVEVYFFKDIFYDFYIYKKIQG